MVQEKRDRQDLFAAWRLFFERLAETYPTVLAFEDMQWADASLLDFVDYLLEWSRDKPLYVLTLARPAASGLRRLELPFHLAVVQLDHGERLTGQGRHSDAQPFLADARETFERLRATPWLQRLEEAQTGMPAETVA